MIWWCGLRAGCAEVIWGGERPVRRGRQGAEMGWTASYDGGGGREGEGGFHRLIHLFLIQEHKSSSVAELLSPSTVPSTACLVLDRQTWWVPLFRKTAIKSRVTILILMPLPHLKNWRKIRGKIYNNISTKIQQSMQFMQCMKYMNMKSLQYRISQSWPVKLAKNGFGQQDCDTL